MAALDGISNSHPQMVIGKCMTNVGERGWLTLEATIWTMLPSDCPTDFHSMILNCILRDSPEETSPFGFPQRSPLVAHGKTNNSATLEFKSVSYGGRPEGAMNLGTQRI